MLASRGNVHAVELAARWSSAREQLGVKIPHNIQGVLSSGSASLGQPGVLRAVIGGGLYLAVLGLLALGLATIIRHTAGAISTFAGVVLVLPLIVQALPTSISNAVARYLPANIGVVMFSTHGAPDRVGPAFSPWTGFALLAVHRGDPGDRLLGPCAPRCLSAGCPKPCKPHRLQRHKRRLLLPRCLQRLELPWLPYICGAVQGCAHTKRP